MTANFCPGRASAASARKAYSMSGTPDSLRAIGRVNPPAGSASSAGAPLDFQRNRRARLVPIAAGRGAPPVLWRSGACRVGGPRRVGERHAVERDEWLAAQDAVEVLAGRRAGRRRDLL